MKHVHLLLVSTLAVITPLAVLAEVPVVPENATKTMAYGRTAASGEQAETPEATHERGGKHKGHCRDKKGKGGGQHGGGQHGKHHGKHHEVVRRLDMIEARMAKIELMLESLMKRR